MCLNFSHTQILLWIVFSSAFTPNKRYYRHDKGALHYKPLYIAALWQICWAIFVSPLFWKLSWAPFQNWISYVHICWEWISNCFGVIQFIILSNSLWNLLVEKCDLAKIDTQSLSFQKRTTNFAAFRIDFFSEVYQTNCLKHTQYGFDKTEFSRQNELALKPEPKNNKLAHQTNKQAE